MKDLSFLRSTSMRLLLVMTLMATTLVACASNESLPLFPEDSPDGGGSITVPDGGLPSPDGGEVAATCGDGSLDPGEECDDRNRVDGDGCDASCKKEAPSVPSACPGTPFPLTGTGDTRTGTVVGDTSKANATLESASCGGGGGKDVVYALTSDVAGRAVVRLSAPWAALLAVRKACTDAASETSCKAVPAGGGETEIAVPLAANETVYLVVDGDGDGGQAGEFSLDVAVSATFCGDGVAVYPEQCDDGNTTDGDGCSAACKLEGADPGIGVCPGIALPFVGDPTKPTSISLAGDLRLLKNTMGCFSSTSSGGADQAYAITPTIDGAITAVLQASFATATLHVREECFNSATEKECKTEASPTTPVRISFPVSANRTYSLFVDTKSGAAYGGLYTLDLTLAPATCGNGVLEMPETCDDGNTTAGDGCSPTCSLEPMPAGIDTCPGAPVPFSGDLQDGPVTYRTTASTALLTPGSRSCVVTSTSVNRKDAVYQFVPPFHGYATIKAKGNFDVGLGLRTNCLGETSSYTATGNVACATGSHGNAEERITAPVSAGTTYYLVVEGEQQNTNYEGVFGLDITIEKSVCGNGRVEGGEGCDDGNNVDGDTCSATCTIEPLGTPSRNTCAEAEDLVLTYDAVGERYQTRVTGGNWNLTSNGSLAAPCGATVGADAFFRVVPPVDGVLKVEVDGTYNVTPALRSDDTGKCPAVTGSGFLVCSNRTTGPGGEWFAYPVKKDKPYWIIVDSANLANDRGAFTMDVSLKSEDCGDGVVGGTEQCDDGNHQSGDGCSGTCTLEPLAGADTCPGYAVSLVGNGNEVRKASVTLSTAMMAADYAATCGGSARDAVVAVTADISGTMNAQLEAAWPAVLHARESCTESSTELGCNAFDAAQPSRTLRDLSFDVAAGVPTYLFIDGLGGESGPGTLFITVTP